MDIQELTTYILRTGVRASERGIEGRSEAEALEMSLKINSNLMEQKLSSV